MAKTHGLFSISEPEREWSTIAPDLTVVAADGTHVTIIDAPKVRPLAQDLSGRLKKCWKDIPPAPTVSDERLGKAGLDSCSPAAHQAGLEDPGIVAFGN